MFELKKISSGFLNLAGCLCLLISIELQAQSEPRALYNWFDEQVGVENTSIVNGKRYFEKYRTLDQQHKFYLTNDFVKCDLVYEGQPYYDMDVLYDLFEGQIIIKVISQASSSILQLNKNKIQSFVIQGNRFVHLDLSEMDPDASQGSDFYEELFLSETTALYKKNRKTREEVIRKKVLYSKFKEKNEYYVHSNQRVCQISNKKDLIDCFPEDKRFINTYYRTHKKLLKADFDAFLIQLVSELSKEKAKVS